MVGRRKKFAIWLALLGALAPGVGAAADEGLGYRAYYQGLLSAMRSVPIADARLVTEQADHGRLQVTTLTLSSAAHGVVDALYPIRYRLRSVFDRRDDRLLAMERFKRTRKVKHDLAWVDAADDRLHYLRRADQATPVTLPARLTPWLAGQRFAATDKPALPAPAGLLDRLALLQALRDRIPVAGQVLVLPVTDGPKLFRYEVRLVGEEDIELAGRRWASWRLRVEGYEQAADGEVAEEPDHAPIDLWIARDGRHRPLRLRMAHSVGDFTVDWVPDGEPVVVALDAPVPPADPWSDEG